MHTRPNRTGMPPLLFLDLETGGLDALQHEILQLGAVLTSPDGSAELGRIHARGPPLPPEPISPFSPEINCYSTAWRRRASLRSRSGCPTRSCDGRRWRVAPTGDPRGSGVRGWAGGAHSAG